MNKNKKGLYGFISQLLNPTRFQVSGFRCLSGSIQPQKITATVIILQLYSNKIQSPSF